jgi:hypothetical protein
MVRATACRSMLIIVCLLLGVTVFGSAQSGKRGQQGPRGVTGAPASPLPSPPERRVALVMGNAAYHYTAPLQNPVHDAQDMARMLKELQFQVILKTDATLETMADAIFAFGEQLKGGGVGLLYYSGHGMQVKGENYLIPIDANVMREDDIKRKTINARDILYKMDEAKSHLNLVFLDACRNNPFPRSVRAVARGLAGMNAPSGTLLVFATNPDNVASDGAERNGTYTKHLLHYLTQPGLEVGMMLRKIRTAVKEETGGQQVPWENGSIEGEFYFTGLSGGPPAAGVTPPMAASVPPPFGTRPPAPPAAAAAATETPVDISGVWREVSPNPGTLTQTTQEGPTFRFTVRGTLLGVPFQSVGSGTIRGRHLESTYQSSTPSKGRCTGTVSTDGRQVTSTCTDSVYGQFETSGVRQE